jgi:WD40 repeat protein
MILPKQWCVIGPGKAGRALFAFGPEIDAGREIARIDLLYGSSAVARALGKVNKCRTITANQSGRVFVVCDDEHIRVYDSESAGLPLIAEIEVETPLGYPRSALSTDGRRVLTAIQNGTVTLWDIDGNRESESWNWKIGKINNVALSRDGLTAAAAGANKKLVVWDLDG